MNRGDVGGVVRRTTDGQAMLVYAQKCKKSFLLLFFSRKQKIQTHIFRLSVVVFWWASAHIFARFFNASWFYTENSDKRGTFMPTLIWSSGTSSDETKHNRCQKRYTWCCRVGTRQDSREILRFLCSVLRTVNHLIDDKTSKQNWDKKKKKIVLLPTTTGWL